MSALLDDIDMVPESYQNDSFEIVLRDSMSIAIFWDLSSGMRPTHPGARLSLRMEDKENQVSETLILHHDAGHMIVPLEAISRSYNLELGWSDINGFKSIAVGEIELPPLSARSVIGDNIQEGPMALKGAVFLALGPAVERRGFRPGPEL